MGQKCNPTGLRIGVIKNWDSRWYAKKGEFGDTLVEDYKLRKYLLETLSGAGVPKVEIERDAKRVRINIHCAKPGMVIGSGLSGGTRCPAGSTSGRGHLLRRRGRKPERKGLYRSGSGRCRRPYFRHKVKEISKINFKKPQRRESLFPLRFLLLCSVSLDKQTLIHILQ